MVTIEEGKTLNFMDESQNFIADLTTARDVQYCSMKISNDEDAIVLFNAMNNPEKRIGDCINQVIEVKDVFCEVVNCENRETAQISRCPRIVLIDKNGIGYQAVSLGIYSALKKVFALKGTPDQWNEPVKLQVNQVTRGERKMLTFKMVK